MVGVAPECPLWLRACQGMLLHRVQTAPASLLGVGGRIRSKSSESVRRTQERLGALHEVLVCGGLRSQLFCVSIKK